MLAVTNEKTTKGSISCGNFSKTYSPVGEESGVVISIQIRANLVFHFFTTNYTKSVQKVRFFENNETVNRKGFTFTCQPASMLLRSEAKEPPRSQSWDKLNSFVCWILGSHTFIVAFAP